MSVLTINDDPSVEAIVIKCFTKSCVCAFSLWILAACGTTPLELESLEEARYVYSEAAQDINIVRYGADQLDLARDAIAAADRHAQRSTERWEAEHYVHLARQRVAIARLIAEKVTSEEELADMKKERSDQTLVSQSEVLEQTSEALRMRDEQLAKARLDARMLKKQLAEVAEAESDRGMVLTLGEMLFEPGSDKLVKGSDRNIAKVAAFMRRHPERNAIIEGHTDDLGEEETNRALSLERADAVRQALVNVGIEPERIATQGYGESMPAVENSNDANRRINRRVEIVFPEIGTQMSDSME